MRTQVTVASTKGEVGTTIPAAAKVQESVVGPARELDEGDPIEPTPMAVPIDRILEYDRNPRRARNEAYVEIETSIRRRGFVGMLPITRRPGEPHYRVAEGGNTVLRILKDLYEKTKDPRFHTLQCLFEPWVSESETLIAHLVENDARGELLFIDRARAVRELRDLIEQETGAPISATRFAALLRERGYSIDQPTVSRLDYAIETLFPLIPAVLRSGVGRPAIDRIRKLDKILVTFLEDRRSDQTVIDKARAWFLACLGRHDREDWRIDPVQDELEAHLAEICCESAGKVRADLDFIERYGAAGSDAPVPLNLIHQSRVPHRRARLRPALTSSMTMRPVRRSAVVLVSRWPAGMITRRSMPGQTLPARNPRCGGRHPRSGAPRANSLGRPISLRT